MSGRDAAYMRGQLASVGILIAPAAEPRATARLAVARAPVDRELIREILITAGAPERHIEWLTASCPSTADALTYKPPTEAQ